MPLVILRILLTGAFLLLLRDASAESAANLNNDVVNAGRFALAVVVGFVASLTWAPLLGEMVAGPITGLMKDGSPADGNSWLIGAILRCQARGMRRTTVALAFVEAVRRPNLPAAYIIGLNHARPCSWLERVFAQEVWRFNHIGNCVRAHDVLALRHDRRPTVHPVPEVNLALIAHLRLPSPAAEIIAVPAAPPAPPLVRRKSIRLFSAADETESPRRS